MFGLHQDQVERVFQKQSSVQEMFEKRRVSLKKLAAKQTRPVQPVAPRPEVKSPLSSPSKPRSVDGDLMRESSMYQGSSHTAGITQEIKDVVFCPPRSTEEREKVLRG